MKKVLNILYAIGILTIFSMEVVYFYDWFNEKKNDWYGLILIIIAFYSTCVMISKIIKSKDLLERVQSIMHDKQMDNNQKLECLDYKMFDIDAFLNDK